MDEKQHVPMQYVPIWCSVCCDQCSEERGMWTSSDFIPRSALIDDAFDAGWRVNAHEVKCPACIVKEAA